MDAVLRTINRHSSSPAMPSVRLDAIRCAACIPMGVAALPSPRKLAQMLALKTPASFLSVRVEGKTLCKNGRSSRLKNAVKRIFRKLKYRYIATRSEDRTDRFLYLELQLLRLFICTSSFLSKICHNYSTVFFVCQAIFEIIRQSLISFRHSLPKRRK